MGQNVSFILFVHLLVKRFQVSVSTPFIEPNLPSANTHSLSNMHLLSCISNEFNTEDSYRTPLIQ